jgi:hypothetical protein
MGAHNVIIPLPTGGFLKFHPKKKKGERGLSLQHVATFISIIADDPEAPTPRFTRADVIRIVWRLLYKREPHEIKGGGQGLTVTPQPLKAKQQAFVHQYMITGFNGAKAARLAGYSAKRAKQTAYDLLHERKRY